MKRKLVIASVLLVVLGAFFYFFLINRKGAQIFLPLGSSGNQTSVSDDGTLFRGSVKDLVSGGRSQKCTFVSEDGEGTLYTTGDSKLRADFVSVVDGVSKSNHIMFDNNFYYFWSGDEETGIKMASAGSDQTTEEKLAENQNSNLPEGMETEYDYKCSFWMVDSSKFNLPEGVDFQSLEDIYSSYNLQGVLENPSFD